MFRTSNLLPLVRLEASLVGAVTFLLLSAGACPVFAQEESPDSAAPPVEDSATPEASDQPEPEPGIEEASSPEEEVSAPESEPQEGTTSDESSGVESSPVPEGGGDVVDPEVGDDSEVDDSQEEPDYFGSYEPSAPAPRPDPEYEFEEPRYNGPFRAGRLSLGLSLGGGTVGDETYFIPGLNVGYFIVNGLEIHLDTDFWLIGDPTLITPSPGLRYVFWMVPRVHPYIGAFYRRYIVSDGIDDADSVGGRAGVYFMVGDLSYFGIGAYYERLLQDHLFTVTEYIGPEVTFGFAF